MAHGKPFVHLSITPHLCQPKVVLTYIVLHFNQIQVSHNHHQFHNFLLLVFCYQNVEFKVKLQPVKWAGPPSPQLTCLFHLKWNSLLLLILSPSLLSPARTYYLEMSFRSEFSDAMWNGSYLPDQVAMYLKLHSTAATMLRHRCVREKRLKTES